jgi:ribosomal-protein-alanine N-acetyltransferase
MRREMLARAARVHVRLELPSMRRAAAFVDAARNSRDLHARWVYAPATIDAYRAFVERMRRPTHIGYLVCTPDDGLAGVINISEIVRGSFRSAYLGYYSLVPHHGRGYMRAGLVRAIGLAFRRDRLHRLEANIQPDNQRSIALVRSLGFRNEGYSPKYLKIGGRWRDHARWASTAVDWRGRAGEWRLSRAPGAG